MTGPIDPAALRRVERFTIRRLVGQGAHAWVFEVEDPGRPGQRLALKLLKPQAAEGAELQRFLLEVERLGRIAHPNIVRVHDRGQDPETGCHYYTMDFVDGGTLADVRVSAAVDPESTVGAGAVASVEDVCGYFLGVLSALEMLHRQEKPLLHRDIKPANILVRRDGIAILSDLGIAKEVGGAALTAMNVVPGTVLYMPPEQAMGETLGPSSDLFAVGLSMYRVLTGKTVYESEGVDSTNSRAVLRHLWDMTAAGRQLEFSFPSEVAPEIEEVIRKACRMRPQDRYQSAAEMGDALREALRRVRGGHAAPGGRLDPRQIRKVGRFSVRRFVAEGGMAWVFEVEDPNLFRARRALKLLKPEAAGEDELRRFRDEVQSLALVSHANLIRVHEYGRDPGTGCHYYTMDFIEGGTLADVQPDFLGADGEQRSASVEEICQYFVGVLSALSRLHTLERPLVHRDIKPANIFLTDSTALLGDLGIAKDLGEPDKTRPGIVPGTPLYMSPEQARGERAGPPSDLFSLGLTMYRVLSGRSVYDEVNALDSTNSQAVIFHLWQLQGAGRELEFHFARQIPAPVQRVIKTACQIRMDRRYKTAAEMSEALRATLREAPRPTTRGVDWRWIAAAALLALVAGGGWYGVRVLFPPPRSELEAQASERIKAAKDLVAWVGKRRGRDAEMAARTARVHLDFAGRKLAEGQERYRSGSHEVALSDFRGALESADGACDELASPYLQAGAEGGARSANDAIQPIVAGRAARFAAADWEDLQRRRTVLQAPVPDKGCGRAKALQERITLAEAIPALVSRVDGAIRKGAPREAQEMLASAEKAGREAARNRADQEAYRTHVGAGNTALREGQEALKRARASSNPDDFIAAYDLASSASGEFAKALAVSAAMAARAPAVELGKWADAQELSAPTERAGLARAEEAFGQAQWESARTQFDEVATELRRLREDAEPALSARGQTEAARKSALTSGLAGQALRDADAQRAAAQQKLDARDFRGAQQEFAAAVRSYEDAAGRGVELAGLFDAADRAKERAERAAAKAPAYTEALRRAEDTLRDAGRAREEGKGDDARSLAREAATLYAKAEEIGIASAPRSPVVRVRSPQPSRVTGKKNQTLRLSVEASDPNDDPLTYVWSVDGKKQTASGPELEVRPAKAAKVEVVVSDGTEAKPVRETWEIAVANASPTLTLAPAEEEVRLTKGARKEFVARTSDADGDDVRVRFQIDGEKEVSGSSFVFDARTAGTYHLVATATDGQSSTRVERQIVVEAPEAPVAKPVEKVVEPPKTVVAGPVPVKPTAAPAAVVPPSTAPMDAAADVRGVLECYKAGHEAKSLSRLKRCWVMSPADEPDVQMVFETCTTVSMKLEIGEIKVDGAQATARWKETTSGECGFLSDLGTTSYEGVFKQRRGGEWVLFVRKRDGG